MAIERSCVLAEALKHYDCDINIALQSYEKERQPRTFQIQILEGAISDWMAIRIQGMARAIMRITLVPTQSH